MLIARQAIFNTNMDVYGYELLFRSGYQATKFDGVSALQATASVLGGLYESGIHQIVNNKIAFINCDEHVLLSDTIELISPGSVIIEILEDVIPTDELLSKLVSLKEKGYKIALDDFIHTEVVDPFLPLADIIKFDLILTPLNTIEEIVKNALSEKKIILAEKVETEQEYRQAKAMGFHLFQGYFFSKPSIVGKPNTNATNKSVFTRLIKELQKKEPSYQSLAKIIQTDANLTYRMLSVSSKRSGNDVLSSIKQALMYMGLRELELWVHIMMMREFSDNKPIELMSLALVRSKFAELTTIHSDLHHYKEEASLLGLLSTIDAMLDQTFEQALQEVSLPESISEALINGTGILMPIYSLFRYYEQGNWDMVEVLAKEVQIDLNTLTKDYLSSVDWSEEILAML